MTEIVNHLWQSTLFAGCVAVLALALKKNRAETRYWLWLAASAKFLIPFSVLVALGGRVDAPPVAPQMPAIAVERISMSFSPMTAGIARTAHAGPSRWPELLAIVWLCGAIVLTASWLRKWFAVRAAVREAIPLSLDAPIPVLSASSGVEPGVIGVFRPVLLVPDGVLERLSTEEFGAIVQHEMAHVRRRDNLTAMLHLIVEILFWFHPLTWWIGAKLVEERERACDEAVLDHGSEPQVYAHGILSVCKFYVESPLPCASGVTGSDLKKRIREIMAGRISLRLTLLQQVLIACAALLAVTAPLAIGILRAQTLPPPPQYTYDAVSIRPSAPGNPNSRLGPGPQGGIRAQNVTVMSLMTFAYDVRDYQFSGPPSWLTSARFDVTMTPDKPETIVPSKDVPHDQMESLFNRHRQRMQAVLRDRMGLVLRAETKELPIYALTVGKGGHKLQPPGDDRFGMRTNRNQIHAGGAYLKQLAESLSSLVGRPVINETGLDGPFDFKMQWTPDSELAAQTASDQAGTSIFAAIQEQLGLKLESKKGPVSVFVIEKIEKPSEN